MNDKKEDPKNNYDIHDFFFDDFLTIILKAQNKGLKNSEIRTAIMDFMKGFNP